MSTTRVGGLDGLEDERADLVQRAVVPDIPVPLAQVRARVRAVLLAPHRAELRMLQVVPRGVVLPTVFSCFLTFW